MDEIGYRALEAVDRAILVSNPWCQQVEAQGPHGKGIRVGPPFVGLLERHRPAQPDIEGSQALLAVQHRGRLINLGFGAA
jgi:hypothetical protein